MKPLIGVLLGAVLIVFSRQVALYLQTAYEKLPRYGSASQSRCLRLEVRPFFIVVLGIVIAMVSLVRFSVQ